MYAKQNSGVPNITGTFNGGSLGNGDSTSGAFFLLGTATGSGYANLQAQDRVGVFNASRSSSVYKDNITEARPTNYSINYFIKY